MVTRNDDPPKEDDGGYESFCAQFDEWLIGQPYFSGAFSLSEETQRMPLYEWVWKQITNAYHAGRQDAMADARMAEEYREGQELATLLTAEIIKYHKDESHD